MEWIESIGEVINYIEENLTKEIEMNAIAEKVFISPIYLQKGFAMLCGLTLGEYIRRRRLTLAGSELVSTNKKIIDIALEYGYDSPDSFTKAFLRFHGVTPTAVRKNGAMIKSFVPLKIKLSLEGGYSMDYKIIEKDSFTVLGRSKVFSYDNATVGIPQFWTEHYQTGKEKEVCGMYGVCLDENMGAAEFEYLIADNYNPALEIPEGCITKIIPKHTWAVFSCKGPMPKSIQEVNEKIFSEWLPNCRDYEIAAGYNIEMYTDTREYPKGNQDENYYSEIWIPVKKK